MEENQVKQRDRPRLARAAARLWARWGASLLLGAGAAALTTGAALICPPAGWITGGVLAIAGGILAAIGGGGDQN